MRPRLSDLSLGNTGLTDEGLATLAQSPAVGSLVALHLRDNSHTDAGLRHLSTSRYLRDLEHLGVLNHGITRAGVSALLDAEGLLSREAHVSMKELVRDILDDE